MNDIEYKSAQQKFYHTHRELCLQRAKAFRKARRHPCIDCSKIISCEAIRCHRCANIFMGKQRAKPKPRCIDCGTLISRSANKRCPSCNIKQLWKEGVFTGHIFQKGAQHPSWKGGRFKDHQGYIRVLKPEHPKSNGQGYVLEHYLVWEQAHSKQVPDGWIIHHLNGIKNDNRPCNLVALSNQKHYLVLQAKAKRIQELEALLNNQHQLL